MMSYRLPAKCCLFTVDVETHSIWHNCLRDETGEKVLKEGMPILLEIFEKYGVRTTFFFTGYIAQKFPEVVKMTLPYGHEVGCHGLNHKPDEAFDLLGFREQCYHLRKAKSILEDISGSAVISFRSPALRVNGHTAGALIQTGFRIDSSLAAQRCDGLFSFGGMKKTRWLTMPRLPYLTKDDDLYQKGKGPIIEVPISAAAIPYIGTTLRIMPAITRAMRALLHMESKMTNKPVVFDIHPNEFLNEKNGSRKIARRTDSFFSYLLRDLIRSKLKVLNLGKAAVPLFEGEIRYFSKQNCQFLPIVDYCRIAGFHV